MKYCPRRILKYSCFYCSFHSLFLFFPSIHACQIENRLRSHIAGTIPYTKGLLKNQPFHTKYREKFDFVLVNHVLQAVCKSKQDYRERVRKLRDLIKPGGYLCVCDPFQETFSHIGDKSFEIFPIDYRDVLISLTNSGSHIKETFHKTCRDEYEPLADCREWHLTISKKL